MIVIIVLLFTTAVKTQCTYVHYNNDPTPWGTGYCQVNADCGDTGVCILKECICKGDRGGPNCQYARYQATYYGWLMIGLSVAKTVYPNCDLS